MNFRQLRVFLTVADLGSFSAAAEHLYLSQSVISRHVSGLEQALGSLLLDRLPRGVESTEAGRVLADYARRLFALEAEAQTALEELRDLRSGRLRIGASMTIGNYLLPRILASYHDRYPYVDIELSIANTDTIQDDLHERRIDVGLTEGFVDDAAFNVRAFTDDELVPVVAANSKLAAIAELTLEDLAAAPCIMREAGSGTRAVIEQAMARYGLNFDYAMSLGSTEAVKQAVIAGAGFTIAPLHTVDNELRAGQLVQLRPTNFVLRRPLHLLQLQNKQPTRASKAFIDLLNEQIASALHGVDTD
ncbi:LysR family transcriptional regulator [Salinisphaera aquimarina]|uniref:LysR family transcriptional regulator n=1 Tax=Salinisphaera aquimarina TaxID=2094031 RepID=A0ABV7ERY3_9GAMM